ncbi:cadherin-related family member 5-like isoform X2 [Melanerpes formicivorus]|uniref:cadherin-related family member 5-like isoform X2 n=1 Tax=Melanerpes formicivorus TaxID=211600 RepID=UPI00358F0FCD
MAARSCPVLLAACLALQLATAHGDGCGSFGNLFTEIMENSAHGSLVARLPGDTGNGGLQLCLAGADAVWFYLDGRSVRLNVSAGRTLDREELESPVLMVALTCAEDGFSPVEYRIIVQVLNENDNRPHFQGAPLLTHNISELAAVHSVVFSTQAEDADGDTLMYVIDTASPDARFFRIDLPNSGKVVLARALDFESRQQLEVVVTAVEMNTKERFNASARVRVNVLDGDDQYPRFLPCTPRSHHGLTVCTSPIYTANVTEGQLQGGPLSFSPGSVYAEDGDRGLRATITYSLLAGQESSRFHIDNMTGAITLVRAVESSRRTPAISLSVMASQVNDANKFAVTQAVVRVLAANRAPPRFARPSYQAFVPAGAREAALLLTFGGHVLALRAHDPDFPEVRYSLQLPSANQSQGHPQGHGHQQLFQVMPNGLVVARADLLRPAQTYRLQVLARDEESGETSNTTVEVEVLWPGQAAPRDPSEVGGSGRTPLNPGILGGGAGGPAAADHRGAVPGAAGAAAAAAAAADGRPSGAGHREAPQREPEVVPAGPCWQIPPEPPQPLLPQRGLQRWGGRGGTPPTASSPTPGPPTSTPHPPKSHPQASGQFREGGWGPWGSRGGPREGVAVGGHLRVDPRPPHRPRPHPQEVPVLPVPQ